MKIYRAKNCGFWVIGIDLSRNLVNSAGNLVLTIQLGHWHYTVTF